jgi:hypothetical protein
MKKTISLIAFMTLIFSFHLTPKAATPVFTDISGSPMKNYIEELANAKIISGAGGKFYPKNNITRAEFAKILALSMELELDSSYSKNFKDVPTWAKPYVGALVKSHITKGKTPTRFGSGENLTRQDMTVFFIRATGLEGLVESIEFEPNFADYRLISPSFQSHIAFAKEIGFITGAGNYFYPNSHATREAVAKLAYLFSFEGHKYFENSLNIVIPTFMDEEIEYVTLLEGEESVEIELSTGEYQTYDLNTFLPYLQQKAIYQSFEYVNGFDWNDMSSSDKTEVVQFFLDFWKNPYSSYTVEKDEASAKQILLNRLNNYYINNTNNRDNLLRTIVWDAVDEQIIVYKN